MNKLFFVSIWVGMVALLSGCGGVGFGQSDQATQGSDEVQIVLPLQQTLKTVQAAVAVRGVSCLMCHADMRSNMITDFGYGSPWFMGGALHWDFGRSWYNDYVSGWQSAQQILGSVIVPDVTITPRAQEMLGASYAGQPPLKLADFLVTPYTAGYNWDVDPLQMVSPVTMKVTPPAGAAKVIAKNKIVIRAPSVTEIQALAPNLFNQAGVAGAQRVNSNAALQLIQVGSGSAAYTTNNPTSRLECSNTDIVVKGTLFLKGLSVNATKGCRIYVTGPVFIEDTITYGSGEKQNLQITSATAIVMGIDKERLDFRLLEEGGTRGLQLGGSRPYEEIATETTDAATYIGVLRDAEFDYGGTRASIDFSGLLLNAPIVHSRYLGRLRGTVIAEAALFAVGLFHFEFDPVFGEVNVLPLLTTPVLEAK